MKEEKITLSTKNLKWRIVAFVFVLVVAVGAFAYGFSNMAKMKEGYYEITESPDEEAPLYGNGIALTYRFTGESSVMKEERKRLEEVYSIALKRAYKLLDPVNSYNGFCNIATINANPGKKLEISKELYDVLRDAYEKTAENKGYNMFAGAFYEHWNSILVLENPDEFDPLMNEEEARRLEALVDITDDRNNFSLTFTEGDSPRIKFDVSDQYIKFCEENEEQNCYLHLNLLQDAYIIQIVAAVLEKEGFTDGFLTTDSGLTVSLSGQEPGEYSLYSSVDGRVAQVLNVAAEPGSVFSEFRSFPFSEEEDCYYSLQKNGIIYYRSPVVMPDKTGFHNVILSSCAVSYNNQAIPDTVYFNIQMQNAKDEEELKEIATDSAEIKYAYTLIADKEPEVYSNIE